MTNEVTHAPKVVIEELDSFNCHVPNGLRNVFNLFGSDDLLDTVGSFDANVVTEWVYRTDKAGACQMRELAVINHYLGIERLQPEREPRYVVEVGEGAHRQLLTKFKGMYRSTIIDITEDHVNYGKDTHTLSLEEAKHIQAVVGGEPKEIK